MRVNGVAILGAGVGGLCAAIALRQRGFAVQVFERREEPSSLGAGLVLWPNACHILDQLHLLPAIARIGGALTAMQRWSQDGEFLGAIDIEKLNSAMGYSSFAVTRKALQDVFMEAVQALGIEIRYGFNVKTIRAGENGQAQVFFSNTEVLEADLIIGADGRMESLARHYVSGDNRPVYQGYVNWVGLLQTRTVIEPSDKVLDFWGVGERFGFVPVSPTQAYWAGCKAMQAGQAVAGVPDKPSLLEMFKTWPDPIPAVIEQTHETDITRIEVYDHEPLSSWHRDNLCLLGDAAHAALPTSGQGACQAIEDAWHLADCLSHHPQDTQAAFTAFYQRRFDKTTAIAQNARLFASALFSQDPAFCLQRNENAKQADGDATVKGMAAAWGGAPARV